MHKLKACVQVLLEDNEAKLLQIKQLYFQHVNIHVKHEEMRQASIVRDFLDRDEKKLLYRSQHYNSKKVDPQLLELGVVTSPDKKREPHIMIKQAIEEEKKERAKK